MKIAAFIWLEIQNHPVCCTLNILIEWNWMIKINLTQSLKNWKIFAGLSLNCEKIQAILSKNQIIFFARFHDTTAAWLCFEAKVSALVFFFSTLLINMWYCYYKRPQVVVRLVLYYNFTSIIFYLIQTTTRRMRWITLINTYAV